MVNAVRVDVYENGTLLQHFTENINEGNNIENLMKSLKSTQKNVNVFLTTLVEKSTVADGLYVVIDKIGILKPQICR